MCEHEKDVVSHYEGSEGEEMCVKCYVETGEEATKSWLAKPAVKKLLRKKRTP